MFYELKDTLDLDRTGTGGIIDSLSRKRFTGYIEVTIWNTKEILVFSEERNLPCTLG